LRLHLQEIDKSHPTASWIKQLQNNNNDRATVHDFAPRKQLIVFIGKGWEATRVMLLQQCSPHNQSQFTIVGYFHSSKQAAHLSAKKTRPLFVEYANLLLLEN
jgi:hypothetical protein